ncbi:putative NRPS-like enzyme [Aspergillus foveolatus]|uniref:putative NRPS-like enzyme n=1 Tax=Aspergillus foveolatus TaxID=210207 RepID=UPI003CCCA361
MSIAHSSFPSERDADLFQQFGFGPRTQVPFATVHKAFIYHALRAPMDIALLDLSAHSSREVTYEKLLRQSQFSAAQRKREGVMPGDRYLPIDGGVSAVTVAACLRQYKERLASLDGLSSILLLEDLLSGESYTRFVVDEDNFLHEGDVEPGCYVIYTSGTTGDPKGVDVTHKNVTNILCQAPGNMGILRSEKVGHFLSVSFDVGAWEVLGTMTNGGTLVLRSSDWNMALREIDILICTPSILARYTPDDFPNIKRVVTATDRWAASATFYNCCGPTETTIINPMHEHKTGMQLTIGKPTPNNNVYILDGSKRPCRKTTERYHYDVFVDDGRSVMYNTGDLARWFPDGSLETLGRNDDQVKIKGFRVELDGVSACLASSPDVHQATAFLVNGELTGFLTPRNCAIQALQESLKAKLPYYAIPTRWQTMDEFPLTPNGKVDKRSLIQQLAAGDKIYPVLAEKEGSPSSISTPQKAQQAMRGLRYRNFIVYRRLFSLVFMANIAMLICLLTLPSNRRHITTVSFVYLTIAVLIRQDMVINMSYAVCCSVPTSWPLAIRKRCAKIYHLGGVHSSAAVMAVAWYTGPICYNINSFVNRPEDPLRPSKHHDFFERVHRFGGLAALVIIWVQTISSIRDQRVSSRSLGHAIESAPAFRMLLVITLSIARSWLFLRSVPVDAEVLSNHAVRLHFTYTIPVNGTFTRLSRRPLLEWHSFATVPAPEAVNGRERGYRKQIEKPPTRIWVRGIPTSGVMRVSPLFTRLVLVGTGSGIGPLLGHIQSPGLRHRCPVRIIWSTPSPLSAFGQEIVNAVYAADAGAVVRDTKVLGRPNLVKICWDAVQEFKVEGVVVISNEKVTKKVVYGTKSRGVSAYGAIWDS